MIKDKFGVKFKFPDRSCKDCKNYKCFQEIDKCVCDFGKYGCKNFKPKENII